MTEINCANCHPEPVDPTMLVGRHAFPPSGIQFVRARLDARKRSPNHIIPMAMRLATVRGKHPGRHRVLLDLK
jgi:hypothetical protein